MGNITTWGKKALKYLDSTEVGICLFCESHLTEKEFPKASDEATFRGWRAEFAAATPTCKGGSSGGAVVLARRHLACHALDPGLKPTGRDWVAMGLELKGFKIVLINRAP